MHGHALKFVVQGGHQADQFNVTPLAQEVERPRTIFTTAPGQEDTLHSAMIPQPGFCKEVLYFQFFTETRRLQIPHSKRSYPQNPHCKGVTELFRRMGSGLRRTRDVSLSLLQNCLQSGDICQGTTSVVPQMAHSNSGFSRCGIANPENKETQGLKPNIFLPIFRHD
jgi:hypothetical protein